MWTTKTENDSMNIRLLSSHSVWVWSTTWMNSTGRWMVIRTHKHIIFFSFVQYKTAMAPSICYTRWQPMQHPSLFIVCTLIFGQRSSAAKSLSQSFIQHGVGEEIKGRDVSVFALLWFFVRPVRRPRFGTGLLSWFLGWPGAWPPGSFGCARWWRRSSRQTYGTSVTSLYFNPPPPLAALQSSVTSVGIVG